MLKRLHKFSFIGKSVDFIKIINEMETPAQEKLLVELFNYCNTEKLPIMKQYKSNLLESIILIIGALVLKTDFDIHFKGYLILAITMANLGIL